MAKKNLTLHDIKMHHDPHAEPPTAGQQAAVRNATPRKAKPPYHREHKTVCGSVSNAAAARLEELARGRGITRSRLISQILLDFLAETGNS